MVWGDEICLNQLGHSTITTTFDTYGHLVEGHLDDVMDRLDSRWRRVRSKGQEGTIEQGTEVSELPRATGTDDS